MYLDKRKKFKLVFDTEATYYKGKTLVYDFACVVIDGKGNIYHNYNRLVEETFCQSEIMQSAYYACKIPWYTVQCGKNLLKMEKFAQIYKDVQKIIRYFSIDEIIAYNVSYDEKALNDTIKFLSNEKKEKFFSNTVKRIDLYAIFCQSIGKQKGFYDFCIENNNISDKGNIKTGAETAYRFLTRNPLFIENHTALSDTIVESYIYHCIKKKHYNCSRKSGNGNWNTVKKFHEKRLQK